jgi:hypothetical protein
MKASGDHFTTFDENRPTSTKVIEEEHTHTHGMLLSIQKTAQEKDITCF